VGPGPSLAMAVASMGSEDRDHVLRLLQEIKRCSGSSSSSSAEGDQVGALGGAAALHRCYTEAPPHVLAAVAQVALALPWRYVRLHVDERRARACVCV
jgi:hypothetical protein